MDKLTKTAPKRIWLQVSDDAAERDIAFPENHSDITWCQHSVLSNEVEYVRADICDNGDAFTAELVEIDGHTYGLRPGAARVVREALRGAKRWRLARTLLLMRAQETMAGTRRYGLMVRPGYSFLDALGDPARAYLNQNNFDEECCRVDEAFDAAMAKDGA